MYYESYSLDSALAMRPTVAYSPTPQFAVVSTSHMQKGVAIPIDELHICGSLDARRSVIQMGRNRTHTLLMGPLSQVNRQCSAFGAEFVSHKKKGLLLGFSTVELCGHGARRGDYRQLRQDLLWRR